MINCFYNSWVYFLQFIANNIDAVETTTNKLISSMKFIKGILKHCIISSDVSHNFPHI